MSKNLHSSKNFLILSGGASLIGLAPIFVKLSEMSPSLIAFYRMFLALPILFIYNYLINGKFYFSVTNKKVIILSLFASLAFSTDLILWHWSITITSISNATIIVNSAPIFVAILSFFILKEIPNKEFFLSFLITYLGIFGLIYFSNNYTSGKIFGDILSLIAALFYATYLFLISRLGREQSINIIFYTTLFCCLFSIPTSIFESSNFIPSSLNEFLNLFALAFLCQFGGQFMITHGIAKISASSGSIGLLMQPITATALAAIIFKEFLNMVQILFIFVTLIGIYLARLNISKN
ncbi:DMT family transporter [SAR86 cluster bacterium]|nr:DMT family transporter [SAR86 cluster bacterium]